MKRAATCALAALSMAFGAAVARADDTGVATSLHDVQKEGGRTCMVSHAHDGSGDGATKPAALTQAIKTWYEYTAGEYGSDWASWSKSAGKKINYTKAASGWTAHVESRPCK